MDVLQFYDQMIFFAMDQAVSFSDFLAGIDTFLSYVMCSIQLSLVDVLGKAKLVGTVQNVIPLMRKWEKSWDLTVCVRCTRAETQYFLCRAELYTLNCWQNFASAYIFKSELDVFKRLLFCLKWCISHFLFNGGYCRIVKIVLIGIQPKNHATCIFIL